MAYASAYAAVAAALRTALARTGVNTGGTADFPRVELHTFIEGGPMDKGDSYRTMTATMESISTVSPDEAAQMNEGNLTALASFTYAGTAFRVIGIVPRQMTQTAEAADGRPFWRVQQEIEIHIINA